MSDYFFSRRCCLYCSTEFCASLKFASRSTTGSITVTDLVEIFLRSFREAITC